MLRLMVSVDPPREPLNTRSRSASGASAMESNPSGQISVRDATQSGKLTARPPPVAQVAGCEVGAFDPQLPQYADYALFHGRVCFGSHTSFPPGCHSRAIGSVQIPLRRYAFGATQHIVALRYPDGSVSSLVRGVCGGGLFDPVAALRSECPRAAPASKLPPDAGDDTMPQLRMSGFAPSLPDDFRPGAQTTYPDSRQWRVIRFEYRLVGPH